MGFSSGFKGLNSNCTYKIACWFRENVGIL